jgi:hypothetical protein
MTDVTLIGWTTPFAPNTGIAIYDTNDIPTLSIELSTLFNLTTGGGLNLDSISNIDYLNLILQFSGSPTMSGTSESHTIGLWDFGTVILDGSTITIPITVIKRLLAHHNNGHN